MEPCDPLVKSTVYRRNAQADSDDSENEGGLGNVTRVVMRPPGQSGKAKRGHLCFDSSFESGNLGRVDLISEFEYDLFIRPDTCNPRFRLWFNFVVENVRMDQRVIFNIVNMSKSKNLFREGMTPLVKSTSRPKWQRMPNKHVYYYRSPEHHNHYVLSYAFAFDREEDVYQFALSYPYSYSRLQAHLELLERRAWPHVRRAHLASSVQHRRLDLVTISHPDNLRPEAGGGGGGGGGGGAGSSSPEGGAPRPKRPHPSGRKPRVVVVLSRIHPGESPTSFVCQGLIDFLASNHPIAVVLREYVIFKIVPMMNPDGVFLGNYSRDLYGEGLHPDESISDAQSMNSAHQLIFYNGNENPTQDAWSEMQEMASGSSRETRKLEDLYQGIGYKITHARIVKNKFNKESVIATISNEFEVFLPTRCTLMGFDLNRSWHQISQWAHPTLHAVHTLLSDLDQDQDSELDIVLDLHAHSSLHGVFIYGNSYNDVYRYERHIVFPKLLAQNAEDYLAANTMYNRDTGKAGTTRRYFCGVLKDSVNCYTLEVSFFGYQRPNAPGIFYYTEEAYCRLGRNIARTFLDYYRAVGVVPSALPMPLGGGSPEGGARARGRSGRRSGRGGAGSPSRSPPPRSRPRSERSVRSSRSPTGTPLPLRQIPPPRPPSSSSDESPAARLRRRRRSALPASPTSPALPEPPPPPLRGLAGKKVGGAGMRGLAARAATAAPSLAAPGPPPAPRLAIIDFNQLTRGGLEQARGRGRGRRRTRRGARTSRPRTLSVSPPAARRRPTPASAPHPLRP